MKRLTSQERAHLKALEMKVDQGFSEIRKTIKFLQEIQNSGEYRLLGHTSFESLVNHIADGNQVLAKLILDMVHERSICE